MECSYVQILAPQLQITQQQDSCQYMPIAADELSTANFSVRAHQYEEKDFIRSQNMSYSFESSVNTAGTLDWWQLANKLGRNGRKRWKANAQGILADTLEKPSNEHNDAMMTAAW